MATKNFVPRGNLEGGIGTQSKQWGSGSFGQIQVSSKLSGSATSTGSFGALEIGGGHFTSASLAAGGSGGVSSYTDLTNVPAGIISGSGQLPSGIISGSDQLPSGIVSASVLSSGTQGTITLTTNGVAANIDSGLQIGDSPTFAGLTTTGDITVQGKLTAQEYIVSSSVTTMSVQQASGSTAFGNDQIDVHQFTGSLFVTSSALTIDTLGSVSASALSTGSFGSLKLANLNQITDETTILLVDADGNVHTDEIDSRALGFTGGGMSSDLLSGTGANTRVPYYDTNRTLTNNADFTFTEGSGLLNIAHLTGRVNAKTGSFTRIQSTDVVATNVNISGMSVSDVATLSSSIASRIAAGEAGNITGVTAGTNLSGGGSSGDVTLNLDLGGTNIVSGSGQIPAILPSGTVSGSGQLTGTFLSKLGQSVVSASALSSPSQGTIRLATNGVNADVDSGLQVNDTPTFAGLNVANGTGSFGRIEAGAITASRVDVDAGTIGVGGQDINSTLVQNISNAFSTTIVQNVTASFSGSAIATASFGNLFIAGGSNQLYTDFSSSIASRVGSTEAGNITSVTAGNGLTGGGSSGGVTLAVQVDDSSLEIDSDIVRVKASGVTNAMLQNDGITIAGNDTSLGGTITAATILDGTNVVSGSVVTSLPSGTVSGSAQITNVITQTYVSQSAAAAGFGSGGGGEGGIFSDTSGAKRTANNLQISGSVKVSGSTLSVHTPISGATAIFTNNIQAGYPTSNPWQQGLDGSYFNNFDNTTNVSEILRFMAGIISHSIDTSSPTANTQTYGSVTATYSDGSETSKSTLFNGILGSTYENARLSQAWTGSAFINDGQIPTYRAILDYLELKGWVLSSDRGNNRDDVGTNPFHGNYASRIPSSNITTQGTFGTFSHTLTGNKAGSTSVSSNSNYFGLGGLSSGGPASFKVRVEATQSFSDNYADSTPDENSTFTTSSAVVYEQDSFGTSNGLILSKIESANPAVIPAAFQDGDFNSVAGALSGRRYTAGATSATNISASGYYAYHGVRAGITSGSQSDFSFQNASDSTTRFYIYTGGIPTDITNSQPTAVVTSSLVRTGFTATSRSLSGAPYLLTCTYAFTFTSEVSKSFDPGYGFRSSILVNSNPTDTWDTIGSTTLNNTQTIVNNSGVSSTGANNYIIDHKRLTKRGSSAVPFVSDVAVASSSFTFSLDSNSENIDQNRTSDESQNYNLSFRATGYNWKGTSVTSTSGTQTFYVASLFGQSASSGSMAVYSRAQGYDSNTLTDTTETFTGEDFRIVLADNVTTFNGAYFTTDTFQTNDNGDNVLGNYDLQVKPGYLVDPGGSYGYWFPTNFGTGDYKYYIRRFEKSSSGTKTQMTINIGKTLVNWNSTTSGVAVGLILKSGTSAGGNTDITTCRIYDPSATVSNLIEAGVSNDNHKNPFSSNIDLYGNTGGGVSSTTYTVPMRNSDGMYLDDTDDELYVIIRYKGDQSPVTQITLAYS